MFKACVFSLSPSLFPEPGGSFKTCEVLHQDLATGLIMPNEDITMLLANQSMKSAFPDHFLHPGTGKLLPIAGNVGFDPLKSKLIPMVDLVSGKNTPYQGILRNVIVVLILFISYLLFNFNSSSLLVRSNCF